MNFIRVKETVRRFLQPHSMLLSAGVAASAAAYYLLKSHVKLQGSPNAPPVLYQPDSSTSSAHPGRPHRMTVRSQQQQQQQPGDMDHVMASIEQNHDRMKADDGIPSECDVDVKSGYEDLPSTSRTSPQQIQIKKPTEARARSRQVADQGSVGDAVSISTISDERSYIYPYESDRSRSSDESNTEAVRLGGRRQVITPSSDCSNSDSSNRQMKDFRIPSPTGSDSSVVHYYFEFPAELCGLLIGSKGRKINLLEEATKTAITLLDRTPDPGMKRFQVTGSTEGIDMLLRILRYKFPPYRFHVTFEPLRSDRSGWFPEIPKATLPLEQLCKVQVSSVVTVTRLFLQSLEDGGQTQLQDLALRMKSYYTKGPSLQLDRTPEVGMVCAAFIYQNWLRCQITYVHSSGHKVDVQIMDFGGFETCHVTSLRALREEFQQLPYQAAMCDMANMRPLQTGTYELSRIARDYLSSLVRGSVMYAHISFEKNSRTPKVQLFKFLEENQYQAMYVNFEVCEQGMAQWVE